LVTSSSAEPYSLTLVPWRCSPSSSIAHWLGPANECHDPGIWPLPVGAAKWANQRSSRLSHEFLRSGGIPESEGPALFEGSAGGGGATNNGVNEVGSVMVVRGPSGPWGRPRGPMEILVVRHIANAPTRLVTTVIRWASSSSSPSASP
jgi:hypothetical protein